eukprot:scaffold4280_cov169-Ochromonas_danica.AAC.7
MDDDVRSDVGEVQVKAFLHEALFLPRDGLAAGVEEWVAGNCALPAPHLVKLRAQRPIIDVFVTNHDERDALTQGQGRCCSAIVISECKTRYFHNSTSLICVLIE